MTTRFSTVSEEFDAQKRCGELQAVKTDALRVPLCRPLPRGRTPLRCAVLDDLERQWHFAIADAEDEGETTPSRESATTALCLLWQAKQALPDAPVPEGGMLYGDGEGGLRIDWADGDRQLRLVIHGSDPARSYLYNQEGSGYGIETDFSPKTLGGWLRWLKGQIK